MSDIRQEFPKICAEIDSAQERVRVMREAFASFAEVADDAASYFIVVTEVQTDRDRFVAARDKFATAFSAVVDGAMGHPPIPTAEELAAWRRNRAVGARLYMARTGEPLNRCSAAMGAADTGEHLPDPFHEAMMADLRRQPHILAQAVRDALTALRAAGAAAGQAYLDEALQVALQATEDLAVEVQRSRL